MEKGLKHKISNEDENLKDSILKINDPVVNGHSSTNVNNEYKINKDLNKDTIVKKERENNDDIEMFNRDHCHSPEDFSRFLKDTTSQDKSSKDVLAVRSFCHKLIYLRKQIFICCCVYTGFLLDGYSVGWCAPVIVKLQDPAETPLPYIISDTTGSWLGSVLLFGFIGSYPAGFLANIIGRKPCLIIGGTLMMSAYLTLTFATNITTMYFARFFTGFTECFSIIIRLLYIGEISSPEIRGTLISLAGLFHNIGALTAYCVGPFVSYRNLNYVSVGFDAIHILGCCFVPETHVYYNLKGKHDSAKSCLDYLRRSNETDFEMKKMIFKIQQKESKKLLWRQLLSTKSNRKALFITTSLYFFQMNSGLTFLMFFATKIFKNAGSSVAPYIATIIIGLTSVSGSLIVPLFIDKFGRRFLLIISTIAVGICMTIMGTYFYLDKYHNSVISGFGWLPLATMITALISYNIGLSSVPHTLTSEMYSLKVRGLGTSISYISAVLSALFSLIVSSYLMIYLGSHLMFWLFAIVNGAAFIFVALVVPETAGKTLIEIDDTMMAD